MSGGLETAGSIAAIIGCILSLFTASVLGYMMYEGYQESQAKNRQQRVGPS